MNPRAPTQPIPNWTEPNRAEPNRANSVRSFGIHGFTILEMLLGMAVLGIILSIAANLLQSNQRLTDAQQARTVSLEDARMAASRMAETASSGRQELKSAGVTPGL